jgi:SWI/SNF-related matrix-associated actin-dependent regulator 1 of chromatin subfamily A
VQLDFNPKTGLYFVKVPRSEPRNINTLMKAHGLDFSQSASTPDTAVLFTGEPYAAVSFYDHATDRARAQLSGLQSVIEQSWAKESGGHIKCPMDQELAPFQTCSVEYALKRNNTLIGDQPGLGKTPIAICFANEIAAKRVLVICPANIRIQWVNRIRTWSTMRYPYIVYPVLSGRHGVHPDAQWTVVSYDLARTEAIGKSLSELKPDLVILDEAHYLKTIDSGRTQAVFGDHTGWCKKAIKNGKHIVGYEKLFRALSANCGAVLALTGTPLPNRPREAYTLARNLCFDAIDWMSEDKFGERFNPVARITKERADGTEYTFTREEVGRAGELQARLRGNFMVRHLKRDVLTQLKLPVFNLFQVEETKEVRQVLEAESLLDIQPEDFEADEPKILLGHIAVIRKQMGIAIAPQVADYAEDCLAGGEDKLVIFAWHIEVLNILQRLLGAKHGVVRIDGSTSTNQRRDAVLAFQHDPRIQIMIGNTLSLGTGTDGLQEVSCHALLAEPEWVPGNNEQAIDRLDRMGQHRTVQADLFVAPGSLLEKILASSLRKRQNTNKALDAKAV